MSSPAVKAAKIKRGLRFLTAEENSKRKNNDETSNLNIVFISEKEFEEKCYYKPTPNMLIINNKNTPHSAKLRLLASRAFSNFIDFRSLGEKTAAETIPEYGTLGIFSWGKNIEELKKNLVGPYGYKNLKIILIHCRARSIREADEFMKEIEGLIPEDTELLFSLKKGRKQAVILGVGIRAA